MFGHIDHLPTPVNFYQVESEAPDDLNWGDEKADSDGNFLADECWAEEYEAFEPEGDWADKFTYNIESNWWVWKYEDGEDNGLVLDGMVVAMRNCATLEEYVHSLAGYHLDRKLGSDWRDVVAEMWEEVRRRQPIAGWQLKDMYPNARGISNWHIYVRRPPVEESIRESEAPEDMNWGDEQDEKTGREYVGLVKKFIALYKRCLGEGGEGDADVNYDTDEFYEFMEFPSYYSWEVSDGRSRYVLRLKEDKCQVWILGDLDERWEPTRLSCIIGCSNAFQRFERTSFSGFSPEEMHLLMRACQEFEYVPENEIPLIQAEIAQWSHVESYHKSPRRVTKRLPGTVRLARANENYLDVGHDLNKGEQYVLWATDEDGENLITKTFTLTNTYTDFSHDEANLKVSERGYMGRYDVSKNVASVWGMWVYTLKDIPNQLFHTLQDKFGEDIEIVVFIENNTTTWDVPRTRTGYTEDRTMRPRSFEISQKDMDSLIDKMLDEAKDSDWIAELQGMESDWEKEERNRRKAQKKFQQKKQLKKKIRTPEKPKKPISGKGVSPKRDELWAGTFQEFHSRMRIAAPDETYLTYGHDAHKMDDDELADTILVSIWWMTSDRQFNRKDVKGRDYHPDVAGEQEFFQRFRFKGRYDTRRRLLTITGPFISSLNDIDIELLDVLWGNYPDVVRIVVFPTWMMHQNMGGIGARRDAPKVRRILPGEPGAEMRPESQKDIDSMLDELLS